MHSVRSRATQAQAWLALAAVEQYPRWTESMIEVTGLDGPDLAVGRRFRVRQPGLPAAVWVVTGVLDGEGFTWESRSGGVRTVASHRLSSADDGTLITLGVQQSGPFAWAAGLFVGSKTRRFLALEADGLKAAAEA